MRMHSSHGCVRDGSPKFRQVSESWKGAVGLCGVRTERPYPPSSTKANSNFNFSKSSRFSSDIGPLLLTAKATWAVRRAKLARCADAVNFEWFESHSALPHRRRDSRPSIYCATSSLPPLLSAAPKHLTSGHLYPKLRLCKASRRSSLY